MAAVNILDLFCSSEGPVEDQLSLVLSGLIAEVESTKARVRIEYDNLKDDYHRGAWRQHGLTKRECEDRLSKRSGEVQGLESALSVLYRAQTGLEAS